MNSKELRRTLRFRCGRILIETTARLPIPAGRRLYSFLGNAAYYSVGRDRRIARDNLSSAYPDLTPDEVRSRARNVFRSLLRNIYDVAAAPRWPERIRNRQLRVEGEAHLERALARGHGAILMAGHQGAWELIPPALSSRGFDVVSVARSIREPRLDAWLKSHRASLGVRTLPQGRMSAAREAQRLLRDGGILGVLLDHRIRRGGVVAEFFGRPARFASGPARLALRTGAAIVPIRIGRDADGRHCVHIHPEVERPTVSLPVRDAVPVLVRRCAAALESLVREAPEEWAWIHPRWERAAAANARPAVAAGVRQAGVLAILAGLLLGGCASEPEVAGGSKVEGPSSAIGAFRVRETLDGALKWVLTADSAQTFDNTRETQVTGLHVDFYDGNREIYSVLTSDTGVLQKSNNNMTSHGNVRLVTREGDTLTTEILEWDNTKSRVRTREPFRLARPDGVLTGVGFDSDPGLKDYTTEDVTIDARGVTTHDPSDS